MPTSERYLGTAEHAQDMSKIASTIGAQLVPRIMSYEASADEVVAWYGSDDPCNEDLNWKFIRRIASSNYSPYDKVELRMDATSEQTVLNESAALTVLLSTAGVTDGGSPGKPWTLAKHPIIDRALRDDPDSLAPTLIDLSMKEPKFEQFDKLYIAVDCLEMAALGLHSMAVQGRDGFITLPDYEKYFHRSHIYRREAMDLGASMLDHIAKQDRPTQIATRPTLHNLGAMLYGFAAQYNHAFVENIEPNGLSQQAKQGFEFLTAVIKHSYLELDDKKVVKGTDKGDLHELLFLLDTNYLLSTGDADARQWYGIASAKRSDKPLIGYPSKNRGLDFIFSDNWGVRLVQLKSSPHDTTEYHPWIMKLAEQKGDFPYVDKRTLAAKLKAYEEWLAADCDPHLKSKVDKYILPSAQKAADTILEDAKMKESERALRGFGEALTRAERRRILRNFGEFKKRNKQKTS